jgi:hypothetical protein
MGVTAGVEGLGPVNLGHAPESNAIQEVVAAELLRPSHLQRVANGRAQWQRLSPDVGEV